MPNRGLRFRRFVAFTLDSMQMKELRSLHVFELIEHPNDVSYIVTVDWSEVADVHSLEDILLMTERTLQSVVETDNPFASVIIEITFAMEPSAGLEAQLVIGSIGVELEQILLHSSHGTVDRSEERRVGKECRSRWSPYH